MADDFSNLKNLDHLNAKYMSSVSAFGSIDLGKSTNSTFTSTPPLSNSSLKSLSPANAPAPSAPFASVPGKSLGTPFQAGPLPNAQPAPSAPPPTSSLKNHSPSSVQPSAPAASPPSIPGAYHAPPQPHAPPPPPPPPAPLQDSIAELIPTEPSAPPKSTTFPPPPPSSAPPATQPHLGSQHSYSYSATHSANPAPPSYDPQAYSNTMPTHHQPGAYDPQYATPQHSASYPGPSTNAPHWHSPQGPPVGSQPPRPVGYPAISQQYAPYPGKENYPAPPPPQAQQHPHQQAHQQQAYQQPYQHAQPQAQPQAPQQHPHQQAHQQQAYQQAYQQTYQQSQPYAQAQAQPQAQPHAQPQAQPHAQPQAQQHAQPHTQPQAQPHAYGQAPQQAYAQPHPHAHAYQQHHAHGHPSQSAPQLPTHVPPAYTAAPPSASMPNLERALQLAPAGHFKDMTTRIEACPATRVVGADAAAARVVELKIKLNELQRKRTSYHTQQGANAGVAAASALFTGGASLLFQGAGAVHQRNRVQQILRAMREVIVQINQIRAEFRSTPGWDAKEGSVQINDKVFTRQLQRGELHGGL